VWLRPKQAGTRRFDNAVHLPGSRIRGDRKGADGLPSSFRTALRELLRGGGGSGGLGMAKRRAVVKTWESHSGLAVFFDSFRNREYGDPSDNALHVVSRHIATGRMAPSSAGVTTHAGG
jgi:hypothetical protein